MTLLFGFFFQAEDGIRDVAVTGVQTCALPISPSAAACKKRKKVFVASTSEVYGKSTDVPFREDGDLVLGPTSRGRWSYACSKRSEERRVGKEWRPRWGRY